MKILEAHWPAPPSIRAVTTTRMDGVSQADYAAMNLAAHVGDDAQDVAKNRQILRESLHLPNEPIWLEQTHSTRCVEVTSADCNRDVDAAITRQKQQVLAILTGDCLPIVLCDQQGTEIAAIHAGWRGLANGIVDNTIAKLHAKPDQCLAWIGPAICGGCYATGAEVLEQFVGRYAFAAQAFTKIEQQWYADLSKLATLILEAQGIGAVYPSQVCTFERNSEFYSYRRSAQTGRIATLIWFQE
ncbi:MAG: peptidoglycan editing factor PgeF [Legionellales bacterium]|nr:peptidoglycan editing factor PgeF [Legionellales bacterium]